MRLESITAELALWIEDLEEVSNPISILFL